MKSPSLYVHSRPGFPALTPSVLCAAALALSFAGMPAEADVIQMSSHGDPGCVMFNPAPNDTDDLVAFESNCDLNGGNPDGNREIFQVDAEGSIVQLTDTTACTNANPTSNSLGDVIAFDSDCDFEDGNVDRSTEIFVVTAGGEVVQLTNNATLDRCESLFPSINGAGDRVAYDSDCDPIAMSFDRNTEVFQVSITGEIVQLTDDQTSDGCGSFNATSNFAGDRVAFESDCDLTGTNEDEISEIFLAEIGVGAQVSVTQLTESGDDTCFSAMPASDAAGETFAFESSCNFSGGNGDGGVEIFRVTSAGTVVQISHSDTAGCDSVDADINGNGIRIVYASYCDPLGTNPDGGFEIFAATSSNVEQITSGASCVSIGPAIGFAIGATSFVGTCDPAGTNPDRSYEVFQSDRTVCGACGAPLSGNAWPASPVASDALFVLRAAIGIATCALCECDVDASRTITASDALRVLRLALGQGVAPSCS